MLIINLSLSFSSFIVIFDSVVSSFNLCLLIHSLFIYYFIFSFIHSGSLYRSWPLFIACAPNTSLWQVSQRTPGHLTLEQCGQLPPLQTPARIRSSPSPLQPKKERSVKYSRLVVQGSFSSQIETGILI